MELFGPDFAGYKEDEEEIVEPEVVPPPGNAGPAPKAVDKAKKGKLVAKSTGLKYQFQIMLSIGVPREEIKKFADPLHWLTYFPPITIVRFVSHLIFDVFANGLRIFRPTSPTLAHEWIGDVHSLLPTSTRITIPSSAGKLTNSALCKRSNSANVTQFTAPRMANRAWTTIDLKAKALALRNILP